MNHTTRVALGALFLGVQVVWIGVSQLGQTRYFCWAPLHEHARLRIEVTAGGRALTPEEVAERYGRPSFFRDEQSGEDWELNCLEHVLDTVRRYERGEGQGNDAQVRVHSRRNGREETTWEWSAR